MPRKPDFRSPTKHLDSIASSRRPRAFFGTMSHRDWQFVPGLLARRRSSSRARLNYRDIRVTIGSVESCPIAKAREEANRFQRMIDEGLDPRAVLKQEEADRAAELSRREAEAEAKRIESERLLRRQWKRGKRIWSKRVRPLESAPVCWTIEDCEQGRAGNPRRKAAGPARGDTTLPGILRPLLDASLEQIDADRVRVTWLKDEAAHRPT
jgi:hypothetical protein